MFKIIHFILFAGFFVLSINTNAQDFEGIIEMTQEEASGVSFNMTWYIKNDAIAYEINWTEKDGSSMYTRCVPVPEQDMLLVIVKNQEGELRSEVNSKDLQVPSYFDMEDINTKKTAKGFVVETASNDTEIEVDRTIDFNFKPYSAFFKADYGIYALTQTNEEGFPIYSVTKDKSGKVLRETKVTNIQRKKLDDSYFK